MPADKGETIKIPHDHDVLSGRGNFVNYHPGNEHFRSLVRKHKMEYVKCPKPQKGKFSKMIYDEIKARNPPGRFLKQESSTKMWYDIGEKKALDKTRQALREGAPDIMKELSGESGSEDTDDDQVIARRKVRDAVCPTTQVRLEFSFIRSAAIFPIDNETYWSVLPWQDLYAHTSFLFYFLFLTTVETRKERKCQRSRWTERYRSHVPKRQQHAKSIFARFLFSGSPLKERNDVDRVHWHVSHDFSWLAFTWHDDDTRYAIFSTANVVGKWRNGRTFAIAFVGYHPAAPSSHDGSEQCGK